MQVALCDDYSLPVDFVNKRRPYSANFGAFEPSIELLDTYCDPRDSKAYLVPGEDATAKVYTSPDREYTHPYAGEHRHNVRWVYTRMSTRDSRGMSCASGTPCPSDDNTSWSRTVSAGRMVQTRVFVFRYAMVLFVYVLRRRGGEGRARTAHVICCMSSRAHGSPHAVPAGHVIQPCHAGRRVAARRGDEEGAAEPIMIL